MKKYVLIVLLAISFNCLSGDLNIQSKTFKNGRTIWLQLPEQYEESTLKYPVIYIFDGQILFNYLTGLYEYNSDKYPPAIIVGIKQIDRGSELIKQKDKLAEDKYIQLNDFIAK